MRKFIPYGRQDIDENDITAVVNVLKSDYLTTGPLIKEFERVLSNYMGTKHAVVVSNGTAALHIACLAAGIEPGDEVIVPATTFVASSNAVLYCNATPVFADIDEKTYNISTHSIRERITSRTKAIIPVHFTGQPCDIMEIKSIAEEHDLMIIEDGAHAMGAEIDGKIIGCHGDMMTSSFHPVKHITTGEGGVVFTNSDSLYKKLCLFRSHGITKDYHSLGHHDEPWFYEQRLLGYNYRLSDIQCALGISQMNKIDRYVQRRREIANMYTEMLSDVEGLILPEQMTTVKSSWHLYILQFDDSIKPSRTHIFNRLKRCNIGVNVHYIPVYYHPYYEQLGYSKGLCPNAENLYDNMITIPLYPGMSDSDVEYVVNCVKNSLK